MQYCTALLHLVLFVQSGISPNTKGVVGGGGGIKSEFSERGAELFVFAARALRTFIFAALM